MPIPPRQLPNIVNVKYPAMRAQLQGLWDMSKELGIVAALTGLSTYLPKLVLAKFGGT